MEPPAPPSTPPRTQRRRSDKIGLGLGLVIAALGSADCGKEGGAAVVFGLGLAALAALRLWSTR